MIGRFCLLSRINFGDLTISQIFLIEHINIFKNHLTDSCTVGSHDKYNLSLTANHQWRFICILHMEIKPKRI